MSIRVEIGELAATLRDYSWGYLVTVDDGSRAHFVALPTDFDGQRFRWPTGERTRTNAAERPNVTLLFPPGDPSGYSLIVDGEATLEDHAVLVHPSHAVLHRPAMTRV